MIEEGNRAFLKEGASFFSSEEQQEGFLQSMGFGDASEPDSYLLRQRTPRFGERLWRDFVLLLVRAIQRIED